MKKALTLFVASVLMSAAAFAQIEALDVTLTPDRALTKASVRQQMTRTASCGPDTLVYGFNKAFLGDTVFRALGVGGPVVNAAGQLFDMPANTSISVSGFQFYGWSTSADATPVNVRFSVFAAGATGLPTGNALATTTVSVDTTFGNGAFSTLRRSATFAAPIQVSSDFVLTVENLSDTTLGLVANNWATDAGKGENLGVLRFNGNWVKSTGLTLGGVNLDCDFLAEPYVTYPITADFTLDQLCATAGDQLSFTNTTVGGGLITSRVFNLFAFFDHFDGVVLDSVYFWDYGATEGYTDNGVVTYAAAGSQDIELFAGLLQNNFSFCVDSATKTFDVKNPVNGDFLFVIGTNQTVSFADASTEATSVSWNFGDGNTSTQLNPSHTYAAGGTYTVRHIAQGCNGKLDTTRKVVEIFNTAIDRDQLATEVVVAPNPSNDIFHLNISLSQAAPLSVQVFDTNGRLLISRHMGNIQETSLDLSLGHLPKGVYLLQINAGERQGFRRLSVQ
ncbi:MAG: PKD domain-containing protein [Bacteroidia bacterium]|nr:PKD domain-containing protein [Bacteroidia bacterium]